MTEKMWVMPGGWQPLPGTNRQVLLRGKGRLRHGVEIERTGRGNPLYGGWNFSPLWGQIYARRAPDGARS